jgi:hypothetical protein
LLRQSNFQFKDEERPIVMTVGEWKQAPGAGDDTDADGDEENACPI